MVTRVSAQHRRDAQLDPDNLSSVPWSAFTKRSGLNAEQIRASYHCRRRRHRERRAELRGTLGTLWCNSLLPAPVKPHRGRLISPRDYAHAYTHACERVAPSGPNDPVDRPRTPATRPRARAPGPIRADLESAVFCERRSILGVKDVGIDKTCDLCLADTYPDLLDSGVSRCVIQEFNFVTCFTCINCFFSWDLQCVCVCACVCVKLYFWNV